MVDSSSYRKIVLRALPKLIKLDNVEVTPEEVQDALRNPPAAEPQKKEEAYEEDYDTTYQQQPTTQFRGHSPVREVKTCLNGIWLLIFYGKSLT